VQFEKAIRTPQRCGNRQWVVAEQRFLGTCGRDADLTVGRDDAKLLAGGDQRGIVPRKSEMIAVPHKGNRNPELAGSTARRLGCTGRHMMADAVAAVDRD